MYPAGGTTAAAAAKFQNRSASPQFANFVPPPPGEYPSQAGSGQLVAAAAVHNAPGSMSMRHAKSNSGSSGNSTTLAAHRNMAMGVLGTSGGGPGPMQHMAHGAATLGHHRGDLIFPDEMDSIEFCMPAPPPSQNGGHAHGLNGELMLLHGSGHGEAFTERRRRGHGRRSNHKMDVEQQVKWSRKNIAATMERFEPTTQSSSSTSSLDYGFAAGVMTPSSSTPSHHNASSGVGGAMAAAPLSSTPSLHVAYNGGAAAAAAPFNHVYSYAYYEPGAAKCHTNVPHKEGAVANAAAGNGSASTAGMSGLSKSPPRNSIRALLAKSFRSKSSHSGQSTSSSPSTEDRDRHTYTTRYGTTENLYEEVNEQKIRKVLSDNRIATSNANGNVKEEQRRVQHNHFRVLDELNLSLEALIMPPTPPDISPSHGGAGDDEDDGPSTSAAAAAQAKVTAVAAGATAQRPRRGGLLGGAASAASTSATQQHALSHASLENLSTTLNSMELKDHAHSSCINPEFDEGDLDSGFSGSGSSSGASYNESLRYYKTGTPTNHSHHHHHHQQQQLHNNHSNNNNNNNNLMHTSTLPHNLRSCRSSTASGTSTSKSSMASCGEDQGIAGMGMMPPMGGMAGNVAGCGITDASLSPFNYPRRCSADTQRASSRSMAAAAAAAAAASSSSASTATGAKPKKNFWTIKP
ncbi:cell wall protein IFF7 [Scaptodrosophila lebanonensis]|uniref:Cell wall protein IFF7 n=1 Tax=Drosophila lebanonensis TaxID=7225 RepID=A0A6J2UEZ4_DROLE|nr:cell wall protein IFF7 [Scaptodrosophila lebanonensis]